MSKARCRALRGRIPALWAGAAFGRVRLGRDASPYQGDAKAIGRLLVSG